MTHDIYASIDEIFQHIDNDGLLVGNNAEWAKEAVCKADYIHLDYYVPCNVIDEAVKHCQEKLDHYTELGSIAHVECYTHFINLLHSMWQDPETQEEVHTDEF